MEETDQKMKGMQSQEMMRHRVKQYRKNAIWQNNEKEKINQRLNGERKYTTELSVTKHFRRKDHKRHAGRLAQLKRKQKGLKRSKAEVNLESIKKIFKKMLVVKCLEKIEWMAFVSINGRIFRQLRKFMKETTISE